MEIDWKSKTMNYICEKALPKIPLEFLIEITDHLNQSQGYNISTQQSSKKAIIKSILKEKVGTTHYWNSFDHVVRNNITLLKNDLADIRQGIQKLNA